MLYWKRHIDVANDSTSTELLSVNNPSKGLFYSVGEMEKNINK